MVSHPETGSDSSIGSDRDRGRDNIDESICQNMQVLEITLLLNIR